MTKKHCNSSFPMFYFNFYIILFMNFFFLYILSVQPFFYLTKAEGEQNTDFVSR